MYKDDIKNINKIKEVQSKILIELEAKKIRNMQRKKVVNFPILEILILNFLLKIFL